MAKFNNYYNGKNSPVCRFGPGGEFSYDWPMEKSSCPDPLGKVLQAIAKIIGTVTDELLTSRNEYENALALPDAGQIINMEDKIGSDMSDKSDAATDADAKADRKLAKEPMLFDNDTGIGNIAGNKQTNRVRARRGIKRKRPSFGTVRQGSLFEHYSQSAKVA